MIMTGYLILFVLGIVGLMVFSGGLMTVENEHAGFPLALLFIISVLLIIGSSGNMIEQLETENYKQGQIDALSGNNIEYKLETQPDSSKIWVKKDSNE